MLRAIGRFLLYVFGFEQPIRLVKQPPGESWEDVLRSQQDEARREQEVLAEEIRTSGYIAPASVGEALTEAWRIVREENIGVQVRWENGMPVIRRLAGIHDPVIVTVDIDGFPNAVKSGRMSVPSSCPIKHIPKQYVRNLVKSAAEQPGEPITLEMLEEASAQCNDGLQYPAFEDPATMKRAAEPDKVRKLYSLYHS